MLYVNDDNYSDYLINIVRFEFILFVIVFLLGLLRNIYVVLVMEESIKMVWENLIVNVVFFVVICVKVGKRD